MKHFTKDGRSFEPQMFSFCTKWNNLSYKDGVGQGGAHVTELRGRVETPNCTDSSLEEEVPPNMMFLILFSTKLKRNCIHSCRWTWCHLSRGIFFCININNQVTVQCRVGTEQQHRRRLCQAKPELLSVLVGRVRLHISFHFALFYVDLKPQTLPWKCVVCRNGTC